MNCPYNVPREGSYQQEVMIQHVVRPANRNNGSESGRPVGMVSRPVRWSPGPRPLSSSVGRLRRLIWLLWLITQRGIGMTLLRRQRRSDAARGEVAPPPGRTPGRPFRPRALCALRSDRHTEVDSSQPASINLSKARDSGLQLNRSREKGRERRTVSVWMLSRSTRRALAGLVSPAAAPHRVRRARLRLVGFLGCPAWPASASNDHDHASPARRPGSRLRGK
jgi:hypothetical protein